MSLVLRKLRRYRRSVRSRSSRTRTGTLRRKIRAHNLQVIAIVVLSLIASAVLWLGAYVVGFWLLLLAATVFQGPEAQMPQHYNRFYFGLALSIFCAAWLDRRLRPDARPLDKKPVYLILRDFLFAPARLLLSLPDNLAAWQRLSDAELHQAIAFIDRVRAARRFPVHSAPVEIPDDEVRERIVFALLHLRILEMFRDDNVAWLRYSGRAMPPTLANG